jgi:hypothetical protein
MFIVDDWSINNILVETTSIAMHPIVRFLLLLETTKKFPHVTYPKNIIDLMSIRIFMSHWFEVSNNYLWFFTPSLPT